MNIFFNIWNNWSNTEYLNAAFLLLFFVILIPLFIFLITKNTQLTLFSALSLLWSVTIAILGVITLDKVMNFSLSSIFLLSPFISLFINILCISTSIGYYKEHEKEKKFNNHELRREYMKDSMHLSIFIVLFFTAFSIFLSSSFLIYMIFTGVISLVIIWSNLLLLKWVLK